MAFIKTPEEIIHREMNPAWTGTGYDFSKLYIPREETTIEDENSLQNKGYVDSFLEGRPETTVEAQDERSSSGPRRQKSSWETKPKEKTYVVRSSISLDGWTSPHELDRLEKEIEEERRRDEEDLEDWLNEGYFLSG